jgi:hypothetical protein
VWIILWQPQNLIKMVERILKILEDGDCGLIKVLSWHLPETVKTHKTLVTTASVPAEI